LISFQAVGKGLVVFVMEKIAVITDSVACLPKEMAEKYDITVVPAGNIYHNGKTYRDWVDLTYSEAYDILEKSPSEFFTGPATPGEFMDVYRKLSRDFNAVVYISLSVKLSTVPNAAKLAMNMAKKELPGLKVEVIDSATATAAEGFIALAAAKAAQQGKSMKEVIQTAEKVRKKVDLYYVLDTVAYVYRTGRVPRTVAAVGSKLNVKPLVTVKNGTAQILGLVRNKHRSVESLVSIARRKIKDKPVHMAILHARAEDQAEKLRQQLSTQLNCVELWIGEFSPLMVYASGKGIIGIAFCPQTEFF